jgi:hypothetical protein
MQIKQEILDYTFELLQIHQPATIDGQYDGTTGEVTMTFVGDENLYDGSFIYIGDNYNEFRERVIQTAGFLVAEHNAFMSIPNREEFIESVTE